MSTKGLQAIRGMRDVLPDESVIWQFIVSTCQQLCQSYGYREIKLPILEKTQLFKRSIGDVTDIVEKEMYTFEDRNGDSLSLRPEATACCVRAGIEHGLLYNQVQRLWNIGPMFRHERPQKGRYRQFYQWSVEAFGMGGAAIEAELIHMTQRLWKSLGLENLTLQINTLGLSEERAHYRADLQEFLRHRVDSLDEDSKRRIDSNPLRVLDSKIPETQQLLHDAPRLVDYLGAESKEHFSELCALLDGLGCAYEINDRLVRGLDYYNHTVFEWVTKDLGSQATVCAGGRYDSLVSQLGGKETPAVGFAMGLERIVLLLAEKRDWQSQPDIYVVADKPCVAYAMQAVSDLRAIFTDLTIISDHKGGSMKSQFKRANQSGASYALVFGEQEMQQQQVTLKPLREAGEQQLITLTELSEFASKFGE